MKNKIKYAVIIFIIGGIIMSYTRVNWQNAPSTATPVNAENLNTMDKGIADAHSQLAEKANETEVVKKVNGTLPDMNGNVEIEVPTLDLSGFATKTEVSVERERINSFTALDAGSTTGDAELIDARIGADAITYANLGEAVRGQFNKVNAKLFHFFHSVRNMAINGNFAIDSNDDGLADNWLSETDVTYTLDNGIQTCRPFGTNKTFIRKPLENSLGSKLYLCLSARILQGRFTITGFGQTLFLFESNSPEFIRKSIIIDGTNSDVTLQFVCDDLALNSNISLKNFNCINLTEIYGVGKEPSIQQMDRIMQHFNDYISGTIPSFTDDKMLFTLFTSITYGDSGDTDGTMFGAERAIDLDWVIGTKEHRSFGGICLGRNGELYVTFRAGYTHGVASNNLGGDIYYSVSYDQGNTWGTPTLFKMADENRDLRDVLLYYDNMLDIYYLTYTDVNISDNYTTDRKLYILRGSEPFIGMTDVTPPPAFTLMTQTFNTPIRVGQYLYLPIYGKNIGDVAFRAGLLRSTIGLEWEVVKTWEADGDNECTMYMTYNYTTHAKRLNMIFRRGDEAYLSYSDDNGVNWTEKELLGFDVAGGVRVYQFDNTFMIIAREQSFGSGAAVGFAMFSQDGHNWSSWTQIADNGPIYSSMARFPNGKTLLMYSKESGGTAHLYIRNFKFINPLINTQLE